MYVKVELEDYTAGGRCAFCMSSKDVKKAFHATVENAEKRGKSTVFPVCRHCMKAMRRSLLTHMREELTEYNEGLKDTLGEAYNEVSGVIGGLLKITGVGGDEDV